MTETIPLRVQFKRMTAEEWARSTVILLEGEIGLETDTGFARAGDGHNRFSELGYISPLDYNLLTNKPNIDGLATKVETAQKLQQKADKETVYTKAESKQELDKKLNLKGGVMTGQLKFKPAATVAYSSSTGGAVNIDLSSTRGAGVVVYSDNDTSDGP
ncbi:TPA: hyaluronidase HylP, partial [Streptococcus pyogenes]